MTKEEHFAARNATDLPPFPPGGADPRVKNALQIPPSHLVVEDNLAQGRAVDPAVRRKHRRPESGDQFSPDRLIVVHQPPRFDVGIKDGRAQAVRQLPGNGGFAGGDTTGEGDDHGGAMGNRRGRRELSPWQTPRVALSACRKYSIVSRMPTSKSTFGSQPSTALARVMSGWRTFGSSTGSGQELHGRFGAGDADDVPAELLDRHLPGVADVNRLVEVRLRKPENSINQIGHRGKQTLRVCLPSPKTVRGSPVSAWPMKAGTTRPSRRRMRGP